MDREKVIEGLRRISEWLFHQYQIVYVGKAINYYDAYKTVDEALELLKGQEEIKEQFIEAFNTIRDAYNTPANREKILLNYLLRNACCCADGERR